MKFIRPFGIMLLFVAIPHFFILLFMAIATRNIEFLNIFNVLGLSYFFPNIGKGLLSNTLSFAIVAAIYFFFYFRKRRK